MKFIGLDLQPECMRLVQVTYRAGRRRIDYNGEQAMPAAWVAAGKIIAWDNLQALLATWLQTLGFLGMPCAISLPVKLVHQAYLPIYTKLPHQEILQTIEAQVRRDLYMQDAVLAIDYTVQGEGVHFVATRQDYLSRLVAAIEQAGLKVKIVDVDRYALERALADKEALLDASITNDDYLVAYGLAMREIPIW